MAIEESKKSCGSRGGLSEQRFNRRVQEESHSARSWLHCHFAMRRAFLAGDRRKTHRRRDADKRFTRNESVRQCLSEPYRECEAATPIRNHFVVFRDRLPGNICAFSNVCGGGMCSCGHA